MKKLFWTVLFSTLAAILFSCARQNISILTKESIKLNEPFQVGFMLSYKPSSIDLGESNYFEVLEKPRIVQDYMEETGIVMVRYLLLPNKPGKHKLPICTISSQKGDETVKSKLVEVEEIRMSDPQSEKLLNILISEYSSKTDSKLVINCKVNKNSINLGEEVELSYSSTKSGWTLPADIKIEGITFLSGPIVHSNMSYENGKMTKLYTIKYIIKPNRRAAITIDSINIKHNGADIIVPGITLNVE